MNLSNDTRIYSFISLPGSRGIARPKFWITTFFEVWLLKIFCTQKKKIFSSAQNLSPFLQYVLPSTGRMDLSEKTKQNQNQASNIKNNQTKTTKKKQTQKTKQKKTTTTRSLSTKDGPRFSELIILQPFILGA